MTRCKVDGCLKSSNKRGYCHGHYNRLRKYGDPGTKISQPPASVFVAILEACAAGDWCITWPCARTKGGYGHAIINGKITYVHRYMCERENGPPPSPLHEAAHSCGAGRFGCVNPKHLRWATAKENTNDKYYHGSIICGEQSNGAKLTEEKIREIRSIPREYTSAEIAKQYGVDRETVRAVRVGKSWKHVDNHASMYAKEAVQ